jgi:tetratricopeptide (TPR) repeat protein
MLIKRLFLICSFPSFIAGCSEFYGSQPPAPVYGGGAVVYSKPTPVLPKPKASEPLIDQDDSTETLKTKPLEEFAPITEPIEIEPEPVVPEQEQESFTPEKEEEPFALKPIQRPVILAPKPEFSTPPPPPFQPLESFPPLSPAVNALASAANQNSQSGNIEAATATIERAIRIEPRNATLYYKLALLRLKQSKPRLAEDLAKKAALLASTDTQLKKHSWLLVARAREMQGDLKGGKAARAKAGQF